MAKATQKIARRTRIRRSIRSKVRGTAERPRLAVYRSNKAIYAQLIDDINGITLVAASSQNIEAGGKTKVEVSKEVGALLAEKSKAANIVSVVFDRGGYLYHGRVKSLADGAREAGLEF
jgi:large subunit ribosomal protein L18